jgi:phosphate transport system ATP-binding protein
VSIDPAVDIHQRELGPDVALPITFTGSAVVQLVPGAGESPEVFELHHATVTLERDRVLAADGDLTWAWQLSELIEVEHGETGPWSILVVPGQADYGVSVPGERVAEFRSALSRAMSPASTKQVLPAPLLGSSASGPHGALVTAQVAVTDTQTIPVVATPARRGLLRGRSSEPQGAELLGHGTQGLAGIDAREISAWFGNHQVLDRVSLHMKAGEVTALIGPSGCGKSTFLRILNRMHEMIPSASLAGEVLLDGYDIYDPNRKLTDARRHVGMVFQKPNPFPAMSIYDNVLASLRLTGVKASVEVKDELVESCLTRAGLWNEVRDRLRQPGGGLSGGQQQRLCIARALAIKPRVLLMDEPCSALDPTSTRRIEETVMQLASEVTIVIVTHNMQQAYRVSDQCAFFLAEQGTPGVIVEHGPTPAMFGSPQDSRTNDYVNGRFG